MTFSSVLASLQVPPDFNRYGDIPEQDVIARLERWKRDAFRTLEELQTRIQGQASLTLKEQADIISATSFFDADAAWVTSESQSLAHGKYIVFMTPFVFFHLSVRYLTRIF
jgi:hypothetical protein